MLLSNVGVLVHHVEFERLNNFREKLTNYLQTYCKYKSSISSSGINSNQQVLRSRIAFDYYKVALQYTDITEAQKALLYLRKSALLMDVALLLPQLYPDNELANLVYNIWMESKDIATQGKTISDKLQDVEGIYNSCLNLASISYALHGIFGR